MFTKRKAVSLIVATFFVVLIVSAVVSAANTPTLNQTINAGTLATDILDNTRAAVASPSASMTTKTFSFDCQYGGSSSTGTLGENLQRIYVMNPNAANIGWTLSIASSGGITSRWQNAGVSQFIDFNDPSGANPGCSDGVGDADATAGQLTIDPSISTITTDCISCGPSNINKGASSGFNQGTVDSVTLLVAAAGSDDIWRGYLTGVGMSQTIPAEQPADSYSMNMTLTVVSP